MEKICGNYGYRAKMFVFIKFKLDLCTSDLLDCFDASRHLGCRDKYMDGEVI